MPYFTVLTKVGQALIATAHATGTPVKLTHLAVGDGEGAQITPREDMSALRREVWRGALNTLSEDPQNPGWIMAEAVVLETIGGFTIREVGLFDETGKLVAVGSLPDSYKPQLAEGSAKTFYIRMRIEIGNASAVTLLIDPSVVLATKEFVAIEVGKVRADLDALAEDVGDHVGNLANPHQVTAAQAGAETAGAVATHNTAVDAHADIRAAIAGITIPQASETVAGMVRLSTAAQALAGTDNATAMSPADVAAAIAATRKPDGLARDNAAMNAFVSWLAAGRASGPVPGGYLWTFLSDEWNKAQAYYSAAEDCYHNVPSGSVDHAGTIHTGTPSVSGYSTVDTSVVMANGSIVTGIRIYSVVPSTGKIYIVQRTAAGAYTVVATGTYSHTGSGWETFALPAAYTVPASGTYMPAAYSANFGACSYHTDGRAIKTGEISGSVTMSEDTVSGLVMGYAADATPANMTIFSPPVSLGFIPAKATAYVLHRAVDAVALNTDITVGASRGSGWAYATDLVDLGAYSASYKLLRASASLSALSSGQSGYARIETANHKRQHIRAVLAWFE
ncbi:Phage tail-collar fibre protein [Humidesulfovibrio mexicanus]|uniref:Phage tail-collar fibre protein n=1 Tax=Humidesulfovibrio mexicanus TaxID=147047 RepID=A0A239C905_9BACT|nr:phage tail protein [Humidesulfovibrio mexicanus]SNS16138.1 Phage tail-collar fibre protein [Humidesulfovibrio mexicanus]